MGATPANRTSIQQWRWVSEHVQIHVDAILIELVHRRSLCVHMHYLPHCSACQFDALINRLSTSCYLIKLETTLRPSWPCALFPRRTIPILQRISAPRATCSGVRTAPGPVSHARLALRFCVTVLTTVCEMASSDPAFWLDGNMVELCFTVVIGGVSYTGRKGR